jgi:hypothetical protein
MPSSNDFAKMTFDYFFAAQSVGTQPIYLSLHVGNPGATGANELSNGTYERRFVTWNVMSAATSVTTNASTATFPLGGGGEAISHGGLWHGASGGTFLGSGAIASPFLYEADVIPVFEAGAIRLRAT